MRRSTLLSTLVLFAWSVPALVLAQVEILSPKADGLVGGDLVVSAFVSSGDVTGVEANVGSHSERLITDGSAGLFTYTGLLSLAGEPSGMKTLTITVRQTSGPPITASTSFRLAWPPKIQVVEPAWGLVTREKSLHVVANCTLDRAGTCTFQKQDGSSTSGPQLDELRTVRSEPAKQFLPKVVAQDDLMQTSETELVAYYEPSDRLSELLTADAGMVVAYDGTRALVRSADLHQVSLWQSSAPSQIIYQGEQRIQGAYLYPGGAVLVGWARTTEPLEPSSPHDVWLWNGALSKLDAVDAQVAGTYLVYKTRSTTVAKLDNLVLRDLRTGTDIWSTGYTAGGQEVAEFVVGTNGDVAWHTQGIPSWSWRHEGTIYPIPPSDVGGWTILSIDGPNAAARVTVTKANARLGVLSVAAGAVNARVVCLEGPTRCQRILLRGDWLAYQTMQSTDPDRWHVFRQRLSTMASEELTSSLFVPDLNLETLSTSGELTLGGSPYAPRLLVRSASDITEVSEGHGSPMFSDAWYLLLGRSVFRFGPPAGPPVMRDAGLDPIDAGASLRDDAAGPPVPSLSGLDGGALATGTGGDGDDGCAVRSVGSARPGRHASCAVVSLFALGLLAARRRRLCAGPSCSPSCRRRHSS